MRLFWQHFRAQFSGLLVFLTVGLLLILMVIYSAPTFVDSGLLESYMEKMPPAMRAMIGLPEGLAGLDGYLASQLPPIIAPLMTLYAVLLALSIVTREVDRKTIDFLLALPVERRSVLLARYGVLTVNTFVLTLALLGAILGGLRLQDLTMGNPGGMSLMLVGQWLLALAVGGIFLLASLWMDDYSLAVKVGMGSVGGAFFLEFVTRAAGLGRGARFWNPFSYMNGAEILRTGQLPWVDVLVLTLVVVVTVTLSLTRFERKQISV